MSIAAESSVGERWQERDAGGKCRGSKETKRNTQEKVIVMKRVLSIIDWGICQRLILFCHKIAHKTAFKLLWVHHLISMALASVTLSFPRGSERKGSLAPFPPPNFDELYLSFC